jgi:hypothetical protein
MATTIDSAFYSNNAARPEPATGVFAKGHIIQPIPGGNGNGPKHSYLRIVPTNQSKWRKDQPTMFWPKLNGLYYATVGGESTRGASCIGHLHGFVDRTNPDGGDVSTVPFQSEKIALGSITEDTAIDELIDRVGKFHQDELLYTCTPAILPGYNSNSFASGILNSVGLPLPSFPDDASYPGWDEPVPSSYFVQP